MSDNPLARWRALAPPERWLVLGAQAALPLIGGLLRLAGYNRLRRVMEALVPAVVPRRPTADDIRRADRLAQLVAIVGGEGPVGASCLRQALFVNMVLRRRGLTPEIRFGVRRASGEVEAHAWVELGGVELGLGSMEHQPLMQS